MDEYEQEHLRGQGRVLHRDKVVMARGAAAVIGALGAGALLIGVAGVVLANPAVAIVGLGFGLPLIGVVPVFGVVRLLVTEHELRLQIGLWGPRVAIDEIVRCVRLAPGQDGARKARVYDLKDGAHAMEIHVSDGRILRITTSEERADALAAAIEEARRSRAGRPRVRVDAGTLDDELESVSVEREERRARGE